MSAAPSNTGAAVPAAPRRPLHGYFRGAASWRMRITLGLKGSSVAHVSRPFPATSAAASSGRRNTWRSTRRACCRRWSWKTARC